MPRLKSVVCAVACTVLCIGCASQSEWQSPSSGLITKDGAGLFYIVPQQDPGVAFFHVGDLNSSASHTSNPKVRTFNYTGTLTTETSAAVAYGLSSSDLTKIRIGNATYDLRQGRVFMIADQGTVQQIPFAPLVPSQEYVQRLKEYASANKTSGGDVL